ncbi:hypothetical protein PR048_023714 [Dryococelus australis]|uniref:TTF-type domain-containing protein n=1 Tax=Dryococelus australis TaxID=614101 RepID=A0ABQ9GUY7_9NEOP|nr:hypothetical protein PR048_023714 [Dryococelus australis]
MNAANRAQLLREVWCPDSAYKFIAFGKQNLEFKWKWLSYCKVEHGAFCKVCVLFFLHGGGVGHQPLGKLAKKKFNNWKDDIEEFNIHQNAEYQKNCLLRASQLKNISCKKQDSVDVQMKIHLKMKGNFRNLLRLEAKSGDKELETHLKSSSQNAMYTSPQIQNEIIEACNDIILKNFVKEGKLCKVLCLLSMSVAKVGRYNFRSIKNVCLDSTFLRGQGYDGAASVRGQFNGVQAHVLSVHPLGVYLHSSTQSLKAVTNTCYVQAIRNCKGIVGNVSIFFNILSDSIHCVQLGAIIIFLQLFDAVLKGLEIIFTWTDSVAVKNANQLLSAAKQPESLVALYVIDKYFSISLPLSRVLQTKNIELVVAMESAALVEDFTKDLREKAHSESDIEVAIVVPRQAGRQTQSTFPRKWLNRPTITTEQLYTFLVRTQLRERLLAHKKLISSLKCLLPKLTTKTTADDEDSIKQLVNTHATDYQSLASKPQTPQNALDAYYKCSDTQFPTVKTLLRILVSLPVTTATNDLKSLKSYLRNSIAKCRLNCLELLNIHRDVQINSGDLLEEFCKKPR